MTERDEKIIKHISLYRLTIRAVLKKLFFDDNDSSCGNVVDRLVDEERIAAHKLGKFSYYMLTAKEAEARGLAGRHRAGDRTLPESLAVLWFCCMGKAERQRLDRASIERILGDQFSDEIHCIEKDPTGKHRVYCVFAPGPTSKLSYIVGKIEKHIQSVTSLAPSAGEQIGPAEMLRARAYATAAIVDNKSRADKLNQLIDRKKLREDARIIVEIAPTPTSLAPAVDRVRKPAAKKAQEVKDEPQRRGTPKRRNPNN